MLQVEYDNFLFIQNVVCNHKKSGRPLTDKARKDIKLRVLLSAEEDSTLNSAAKRHGKNKSEYIRYLISLCK